MHHWQWREALGIPYLTCDLLEPWMHGFFTRSSWPTKPEAIVGLAWTERLTFRTKQVHGNRILWAAEMVPVVLNAGEELPEADGVMAEAKDSPASLSGMSLSGISLWVATADCTPVLMGDVRTGRVAALHAGWRGTAAKITIEAVQGWQDRGSHIADLRIAMGPAISGAVYQVDLAVAMQVCQTIVPGSSLSPETLWETMQETMQEHSEPPLLPDAEPGKVRLDVRRVNALQLAQLGLKPEQIAIAPHCTYQESDRFFSYRRTGEKQVQWSGICP